jgi:hypothetical protein
LLERFSILVGLLDKQKEDEKQVEMMINALYNKKKLFANPKLG